MSHIENAPAWWIWSQLEGQTESKILGFIGHLNELGLHAKAYAILFWLRRREYDEAFAQQRAEDDKALLAEEITLEIYLEKEQARAAETDLSRFNEEIRFTLEAYAMSKGKTLVRELRGYLTKNPAELAEIDTETLSAEIEEILASVDSDEFHP